MPLISGGLKSGGLKSGGPESGGPESGGPVTSKSNDQDFQKTREKRVVGRNYVLLQYKKIDFSNICNF